MYEVSDNIQSLAQSYGERFCLEAALSHYNSSSQCPTLKCLLSKIIRLHCLALLKDNLAWYLIRNVISSKAAAKLEGDYQQAVKDIVPHINDIIEAFNRPNIPELSPPIMRDYVKFNC